MKNYLLVLAFILNFLTAFAQPTIPYATEQPKWVFPVYAEDATGKKDTIYLGYDSGSSGACDVENSMGEKWFVGDSDFSLATSYWIDPVDSVLKVSIIDTIQGMLPYNCGTFITLSNVVMPVTFKWDISLLRSDSIPFIDQDPAPRAQLNIQVNSGAPIIDEPGTTCDIQWPIIATDSINNSFYDCFVMDSLRLLDPFGSTLPQSFDLQFTIIPWTGDGPLYTKELMTTQVNIFPNPAKNFLVINGIEFSSNYDIRIYNPLFGEIKNFSIDDSGTLDVSSLVPGVYFLWINFNNLRFTYKFIKL